ncbi:MAG TPA: hypothetical protein VFV34_09220 [Blastocatellia bacterium]|nr:hypothetical protein [Blastocatellia bacterium]
MTVTIELPDKLESELVDRAARAGVSLEDYILSLLATNLAREEVPRTGAELVQYWQRESLLGTRKDIADSQTHARTLREQAERRSRD